MNRTEKRTLKKQQHKYVENMKLPAVLTPLPRAQWPMMQEHLAEVYVSYRYLVQVFDEGTQDYPSLKRLSICSVKLNNSGSWADGLTWDTLQQIKHDCGFGGWFGVEVYPPDEYVVNVANFRHLWVSLTPFGIGWTK